MPGALEGIRILEWAEWGQVPMATSMLGDMGAEVVKIEHPVRGDGARGHTRFWGVPTNLPGGSSLWYETCNRNKRGITLNLADTRGRDIVYRLIKNFDVFASSFSPKLAKKFGLDYESLRKHNPGIISSFGSAFGRKGPAADLQGFDWAGLGRAGLFYHVMGPDMKYTNLIDGLADQAGAVMVSQGILAALVARNRTGEGQEVESSLLGSIVNLQRILSLEFSFFTGHEPPKLERKKTKSPLQNIYQCQDGRWLAFMMMQSDKFWTDFCKAVGLQELVDSPKFQDRHVRSDNAEELTAILDRTFAAKPYPEWEKVLSNAGMLFSPIISQPEVAVDPQSLENEYVIEYEHPRLGKFKSGGFPIWFSKTPCSVKSAAPEFGQHTEEVLVEMAGYSWEELSGLKDAGIL